MINLPPKREITKYASVLQGVPETVSMSPESMVVQVIQALCQILLYFFEKMYRSYPLHQLHMIVASTFQKTHWRKNKGYILMNAPAEHKVRLLTGNSLGYAWYSNGTSNTWTHIPSDNAEEKRMFGWSNVSRSSRVCPIVVCVIQRIHMVQMRTVECVCIRNHWRQTRKDKGVDAVPITYLIWSIIRGK